jgi:hypothetical protein
MPPTDVGAFENEGYPAQVLGKLQQMPDFLLHCVEYRREGPWS